MWDNSLDQILLKYERNWKTNLKNIVHTVLGFMQPKTRPKLIKDKIKKLLVNLVTQGQSQASNH